MNLANTPPVQPNLCVSDLDYITSQYWGLEDKVILHTSDDNLTWEDVELDLYLDEVAEIGDSEEE